MPHRVKTAFRPSRPEKQHQGSVKLAYVGTLILGRGIGAPEELMNGATPETVATNVIYGREPRRARLRIARIAAPSCVPSGANRFRCKWDV